MLAAQPTSGPTRRSQDVPQPDDDERAGSHVRLPRAGQPTSERFAARLHDLMAEQPAGPSGRPFNRKQLYERIIEANPDLKLSPSHLYQLVDAATLPPRLNLVEAIARTFGKTLAYFDEEPNQPPKDD